MRHLVLVALLLVPSTCWAGKLDLAYYQPSPTKAFMWSAVAPAGGMFYLAKHTSQKGEYVEQGLLFLAVESAMLYLLHNQARQGKNIVLPLTVFLGIKVFEFDLTIDAAEAERHKTMTADWDSE